jgi:hypothetical protein
MQTLGWCVRPGDKSTRCLMMFAYAMWAQAGCCIQLPGCIQAAASSQLQQLYGNGNVDTTALCYCRVCAAYTGTMLAGVRVRNGTRAHILAELTWGPDPG